MKIIVALLYLGLAAWAGWVMLDGWSTFAVQDSATQQGAVAAWTVARVAGPYIFVRSLELFDRAISSP